MGEVRGAAQVCAALRAFSFLVGSHTAFVRMMLMMRFRQFLHVFRSSATAFSQPSLKHLNSTGDVAGLVTVVTLVGVSTNDPFVGVGEIGVSG